MTIKNNIIGQIQKINNTPHSSYTKQQIEFWKQIILELLEINPCEVGKIIVLKQSTKLAFSFFRHKLYIYKKDELIKLLRLLEKWTKLSEQQEDKKLISHFYGHTWYIAQCIFKRTWNITYANKSEKYFEKALDKYENDIGYKMMINNNIIKLWNNIIFDTKKDIRIKKKWIKITIQKINEQLELFNKNNKINKENKYKTLKSNLENYLKNIKYI